MPPQMGPRMANPVSRALRRATETQIIPVLLQAGMFRIKDDPHFGAWSTSIKTYNWTLFHRASPDTVKRFQVWTGTPTQRAIRIDVTTLHTDKTLDDEAAAKAANAAYPIGHILPERSSISAYVDRRLVAYHRSQALALAYDRAIGDKTNLRIFLAPVLLIVVTLSALAWPFCAVITRKDRTTEDASAHILSQLDRLTASFESSPK